LLLLLFFLVSEISGAQSIPQFELTKDGVKPIVVMIDSLNADQLYTKTLRWIHEYFKNAQDVLKIDIKNDKLRIEDTKQNVWFYRMPDTTLYYDVEYLLSINFEDNKIRISFDFGNTWNRSDKYVTHSYCINYKKLWKENGEIHPIYKDTKHGIDQMMNELSISLINYLRDNKNNIEEEKESDWMRLRHKIKSKIIY